MITPWIIKYRPKRISDIVNQEEAIKKIIAYLNSFPKYHKKAILLYGPPGVGKTSSVYAIANELNYEVVEVNASDNRDFSSLKKIVGNASKYSSLFRKKRLILVDEVDGISGKEDRGGLKTLIEIIEKSETPIILTANDPWDEKLKPLREIVDMIEFKPLPLREAVRYLQKICREEKLQCDYVALIELLKKNNGDLRSAINDLQSLSYKKKIEVKDVEELGERDREKNIFEALKIIFKTDNIFTAMEATNNLDLEPEEIIQWIEENIPIEYKKPNEVYKAYDRISKADIWLARIIKSQYWRFLVYANVLMTAGVSKAKENVYRVFSKYRPPSKIKILYKTKRYRELLDQLLERMRERLHISKQEARKFYLPLIEIIYLNKDKNPLAKRFWEKIKKDFNIDRYEEEALKQIAKLLIKK